MHAPNARWCLLVAAERRRVQDVNFGRRSRGGVGPSAWREVDVRARILCILQIWRDAPRRVLRAGEWQTRIAI